MQRFNGFKGRREIMKLKKVLMEAMQRKDRKGFVSTYITPNIETGYIAMLYPETPNHPMQSYYLTNKGREALDNL